MVTLSNLKVSGQVPSQPDYLDRPGLKPAILTDWTNLELKTGLKEGQDYVLVSADIWRKFKSIYPALAFPEIPIFFADQSLSSFGVEPSQNYLHKKEYKNGYPDLEPMKLEVSWLDLMSCAEVFKSTILVSKRLTVKHLLFFLSSELNTELESMRVQK